MKGLKLTISVLISNNYDNVKRCLDSIKPLLEETDAELILTDTGCDRPVRELIETYSSHIINFTWCNDFSAARNVGLKAASGEWFLYVDDDEWFEDTSAISDFLNSPEEKDYNVAFYVQRNYLDYNGINFIDHNVDRILRINPELHFEHRIHEAYSGIEIGVKKLIGSYVHHYGYIYRDEEEMMRKHERNQKLLELECNEHPEDMRMQYQLVINQYEIKDWDKAIEYAENAIKRQSDSEYWDACHTAILCCLEQKQDWQMIIALGEEYLQKNIYPFDRFGIMQYLVTAYWNTAQLQNICEISSDILMLYSKYKADPSYFNRNQLMRTTFVEKENMTCMLIYVITSALCMKRMDIVTEFAVGAMASEVAEVLGNADIENWIAQRVNTYSN